MPIDRRYALANRTSLPQQADGTVLFADISGFTALTEALVHQYGRFRGVDELARHFNRLFELLIAEIHYHGGSVIGFAGDAITCWFDEDIDWAAPQDKIETKPKYTYSIARAASAAFGLQHVMGSASTVQIGTDQTVVLGLKAVLSSGKVRRLLVGNPDIQVIDVLAGSILDQVAAGEQIANQGEILVDRHTIDLTPHLGWSIKEWRQDEANRSFAIVTINSDMPRDNSQAAKSPNLTPLYDHQSLFDSDAMRAWVLPPVYERIVSQDRFLAELRPAAALFLKFGGIDYDNDSEAGLKLDRYIRWVQSIVNRYEGSVIQLTIGDKGSYLYSAFGAPIAHDDNLARAAATALELQQMPTAMDYIASVQMGITQGRMRVGAYGSPTRQTYAVLGDATNLAARLMSRAAYGQILVNQLVVDELEETFEFRELGYATFKGKSDPEAIYSLVRQQSHVGDIINPEYDAPLFGRDTELAHFESALVQANKGSSQIVRVSGAAGIGKSHLAVVALRKARESKFKTVVGACQSTAQESAYFPIRQIVRQLLNIPELSSESTSASAAQQRQISQIEATLQVVNPDWLLRLPLLGDLLGLPIPDTPTTAAFDAQLRREALITLVIDIIQSRAKQESLLILVEDVHWMDEASQELILGLARAQTESPFLLMLMHRPTMRANLNLADLSSPSDDSGETFLTRLAELPNQTYLELNELTPDGTAALVADRLASSNISSLALDLIQGLAQGNPFYVEELVDALLDSEKLVPLNGTWVLTNSVISALRSANLLTRKNDEWRLRSGASLAEVELGIPDSIHGIVLARLDRLPESVKLTLKVASVIGHVFEFEMLAHAHPTINEAEALVAQIELIEERDFARLDTPDPQPRYAFRHNITQEVVYRTLLDEQRRGLHLAVGQAVESFQPDAVERLAYHFYNGDLENLDVRAKAMTYLGEAGDRAKRDYANETALAFYDRALGLEERWPWMRGKIEILHLLGQRQEEMETLDYAEYAKVGPNVELSAAWGEYYESVGEYPAAIEKIQASIDLASGQDDVREALRGRIRLADIDLRQGNYVNAERQYLEALEDLEDYADLHDEQAQALYGIGIVKRDTGRYEDAEKYLNETLVLCRKNQNRQREAKALTSLGFTAFIQRNLPQATNFHIQAKDIYDSIGDRAGRGESLQNIGQVRISEGEYTEALEYLNEAIAIQKSVNNLWLEAVTWSELGIVYMFVGDWEKAKSTLEHGLELCGKIGAEVGKAYFSCNLGQTLRELGELETARILLKESISIAKAQNDKVLEGTCLSDLAILYYQMQDYESSLQYSLQSLKINQQRNDISQVPDLTRIAITYLEAGQKPKSEEYINQALRILKNSESWELDYPHREYFHCYQILKVLGKYESAVEMIRAAYNILNTKANKISDLDIRDSFLKNVSFNQKILVEARSLELEPITNIE